MEKNKEIWKDIYFIDKEITYDYRGLYQVSNYGRVKSLSKTVRIKNNHTKISKEKILKPGSTSNGYLIVNLYKNEKDRLARECSHIYENSLGKTRLVNEDIFNEVDTILSKYKGIIGGKDE